MAEARTDNVTTTATADTTAAAQTAAQPDAAPELKIRLADPFMFEGQEIKEVDLSGLFDLTAADLCAIDLQMMARGYTGARMELTRQYALLVAARVNGKPWEWLDRMRARDCIRLRETVTTFFYARG